MHARNLIAAVAMLAAGGVFAGEVQTYPFVDFTQVGMNKSVTLVAQAAADIAAEAKPASAPKTRAEVRAELARDYAEGHYVSTRPEFVDFSNVAGTAAEAGANGPAQAAKQPVKVGG